MNPEGICIDSFPLVNKNGIFIFLNSKNLKFKKQLCTQALINIQNFAHKL